MAAIVRFNVRVGVAEEKACAAMSTSSRPPSEAFVSVATSIFREKAT